MQKWNRWVVGSLSFLIVAVWLAGCSSNATRATTTVAPAPGSITWQRLYRPQIDQLAQRYISGMTLDQKIGQLIVQGLPNVGYNQWDAQIIQEIQPGGTMWYQYAMPDVATARSSIAAAQHDSTIPMLTMSDYETASDADTFQGMFPLTISSPDLGARDDPALAYATGKMIAHQMLSVGMNTDWAPVVDVLSGACGPDTCGRSYGSDPQLVTTIAGKVLAGLQDSGVIGTLKHFPGLGSPTNVDAHAGLPIFTKSRQDVEQWDLAPYRALISSADPPGMIMGTDVLIPSIDPHLPAELSPTFMTDILRNELHYDGVVVTDALYMKGITNDTPPYYKGVDQFTAGVMSIQAGCDLLDTSFTLDNSLALVARIKQAIDDKDLTVARIEQSDLRILRLKINHGLIPFHPTPTAPQPQYFATGDIALAKTVW